MVFDTVHISTSIERAADDVYAYASNPRNLSSWAGGLVDRDVEFVDNAWVIDSPMGRVTVEFASPNQFGILDHDVTLPSGEVVANPMRVIRSRSPVDSLAQLLKRAREVPSAYDATR